MSYLVLIRGLPGSGKTTLACELMNFLIDVPNLWAVDCVLGTGGVYKTDGPTLSFGISEVDMFMVDENDKYSFDANRLSDCHNKCRESVEKHMKLCRQFSYTGYHFVTNTFMKRWELEDYLQMAKTYGWNVVVVNMKTTHPNLHGVTKNTIERMSQKWEECSELNPITVECTHHWARVFRALDLW